MKKILPVITLLLSSYLLTAQNKVVESNSNQPSKIIITEPSPWDSNLYGINYVGTIIIPDIGDPTKSNSEKSVASNNVGIGTTSPSFKLQVIGDIYANGGWLRASGSKGLYFQSYGGGLYMNDATWIRTYGNKSFYHNTGTMRTDGTFQVGPSGDRFIVNTSGNVGIGTTSPDFTLQVENNVAGDGGWTSGINIKSINATTGEAAISFNNVAISANHWIMGLNQSNKFGIAYGSSFNNSYTKFTIDIDGKVGIGISTPTKKLDVSGDINYTGNLYKNGQLVDFSGGSSVWETNGTSIYYNTGDVGIGTNTPTHKLHLNNAGSAISFGDNNSFATAYNVGGLNCLVGEFGATDSDILQLHGKKGISITTGNYQNGWYEEAIHIDSKHTDGATVVRVNGKLFAKVVEVDVNVWADYVFEKDYELMSITELETYINQNKHLPDVPNEKEVKESGVNLGEMDKVLLQKIEELTLYIIQLENRISEIENK